MNPEPAIPQQQTPPASPAAVAPAWHTILFVVVIIVFSALSARSQHQMIQRHGRVPAYVLTLAWEYLLLGYIVWGARKRHVALREIVGGRWASAEKVLTDVVIAFAFWLVAAGVLAGLSFLLGLSSPSQISEAKKQLGPLLPRNAVELGLWLALSVTAGFCEEIMFRGYLQQQFRAATRSTFVGIIGQAVVFGIAHAYQGGRRIILIACYGVLFGLLAAWRRSLRPGMIGHALQDSFSGIAFRFLK